MDRRLFLKGAGAGVAGLGFPDLALSAWLQQPPLPGKSLWSGLNGRSAGFCRVIGIGGAGCNIVRAAWSSAVFEEVALRPEFICVDLGQQALAYVAADNEACPERTPMKTVSLAPVGAGGWVNGARGVALRQRDTLSALVADADIVFLVAGLGGGTGSGVTPIMTRLAREADARAITAVVTPFAYERVRLEKARAAIRYIRREAYLVMEFSNEEWSNRYSDNMSIIEVFYSLERYIGERIREVTKLAT